MFDINFRVFGWLPVFFCLFLGMEQKNQLWKIVIGIVLTPVLVAIFFADRIALIVLPHIESKTIKQWFDNMNFMTQSVWRVGAIALIFSIFKLITWMVA